MAPVAGVKKLDTVLRIDQLVERGGKRDLRVRGAESRLAASRFDLDDTARQQLGVLRYAYYNLRLAQEKLMLARETAELYGKALTLGDLGRKSGILRPLTFPGCRLTRHGRIVMCGKRRPNWSRRNRRWLI